MEINDQFRKVFEFANETNRCIFVTGKAGTGKTTLLRYIKENCFKQMAVLAPTGVAAIQAGGNTIHSFFQLPFSPFLPPLDKTKVSEQSNRLMAGAKLNAARRSVIRQLDLLILDEISMVRCDVLDAIDVMLRTVRRQYHLPFGGVQVLFFGDLYQLPPVVQEAEWALLSEAYASPFFFEAKVVAEVNPIYVELEKIYRQKDTAFVELLNKVRNNQLDENTLALLNSRYGALYKKDNKTVSLVTHNYMADSINKQELDKLEGQIYTYQALISGVFPEKAYPAEEKIELKCGSRIMFVKNDSEKRYYNGKLGVVQSLGEKSVKVQCDGETELIEVKVEHWDNIQYRLNKSNNTIEEEQLGRFSQYPLRLSWAITIHKSQGLTFDQIEIDAEKAFSNGQVYVALSRCKSLEGIHLRSKINPFSLQNHEKVVKFSQTKQTNEVVDVYLAEGKRTFLQKVLLDIYSLQQIVYQSKELVKLCHHHAAHLDQKGIEWVENWNNQWMELSVISRRFENQLVQVFNGQSGENLEERLEKASLFFKAQIKGQIEEFKVCKLITESKEAANEINGLLEEMWGSVFAKFAYIQQCGEEFKLENYMKMKSRLDLPAFRLNIYATHQKEDNSGIPYPELYQALRDIRDRICEEEGLPIYLVATKKSLVQMCTNLPLNKKELLEVKGFGASKVEQIGSEFLKRINEYVQENSIEKTIYPAQSEKKVKVKKEGKPKVNRPEKIDTFTQSYTLFKLLGSVEKVASARQLASTTIEGHLARFVGNGDIELDVFLSLEKQNHIQEKAKGWKAGMKLNEMKNLLDESISFADLRFYFAKFPFELNSIDQT